MTNPSENNHRPRAARGADKHSTKAREDRSKLVKNNAPNSSLWGGDVKTSGEALVQAGADLAAGLALATSLRQQAETADKEVRSLRIAWDERFGVFAGNVEIVAVKPEDITGMALPLLVEQSYKLAPPVSVTARYDALTAEIRIFVRKP